MKTTTTPTGDKVASRARWEQMKVRMPFQLALAFATGALTGALTQDTLRVPMAGFYATALRPVAEWIALNGIAVVNIWAATAVLIVIASQAVVSTTRRGARKPAADAQSERTGLQPA